MKPRARSLKILNKGLSILSKKESTELRNEREVTTGNMEIKRII